MLFFFLIKHSRITDKSGIAVYNPEFFIKKAGQLIVILAGFFM